MSNSDNYKCPTEGDNQPIIDCTDQKECAIDVTLDTNTPIVSSIGNHNIHTNDHINISTPLIENDDINDDDDIGNNDIDVDDDINDDTNDEDINDDDINQDGDDGDDLDDVDDCSEEDDMKFDMGADFVALSYEDQAKYADDEIIANIKNMEYLDTNYSLEQLSNMTNESLNHSILSNLAYIYMNCEIDDLRKDRINTISNNYKAYTEQKKVQQQMQQRGMQRKILLFKLVVMSFTLIGFYTVIRFIFQLLCSLLFWY